MNWTIDRIEGDVAIVENQQGKTMEIALDFLPIEVKEGDILTVCINKEATLNRADYIAKLMKNVWADD